MEGNIPVVQGNGGAVGIRGRDRGQDRIAPANVVRQAQGQLGHGDGAHVHRFHSDAAALSAGRCGNLGRAVSSHGHHAGGVHSRHAGVGAAPEDPDQSIVVDLGHVAVNGGFFAEITIDIQLCGAALGQAQDPVGHGRIADIDLGQQGIEVIRGGAVFHFNGANAQEVAILRGDIPLAGRRCRR